jgi:site-specific DNA recombinase
VVKAAAVYARISSDPEGDRLGVTRQREDCEALAARKGWPVAEVYIDDDRSAYSGKPRPEYRRLLDDIASRSVDALVVYNLDRLHRQPRELEAFFDITDAAGRPPHPEGPLAMRPDPVRRPTKTSQNGMSRSPRLLRRTA